MEASCPVKRVEKRIRTKACAHSLSLYAVFNYLSQVTGLHITNCKCLNVQISIRFTSRGGFKSVAISY